jgi:hypothetical protein
MNKMVLTRTSLLLDVTKVRRLRKILQAQSNSEAVRRIIDERLAMETDLSYSTSGRPFEIALSRLHKGHVQ